MRAFARFGAVAATLLAAATASAQIDLGDQRRENLGPAINTLSIEILPIVSPDGATLYFDRKHDAGNVGGVNDQDDIYFATRLPDGRWSEARNVGAPLNTPGSDVLYWISSDGNTALVHHGAVVRGKPVGMAIARRTKGRWSRPVAIRIDGVSSLGDNYYAFITPDRRSLLLSYAPDPAQPNDLEIFVCGAIGSDLLRWGRPRSLGETINTSGFDGAPFLAADERTLYFASDGRGGLGSSDLFMARRLDTGWTNWSQPVNLGGAINTPRFDASISIPLDGRDLYMSGSGFVEETNYGRSDIWRIPLPQEHRPAAIVTIDGSLVSGRRGVRGLVRVERLPEAAEIAATVSDAQGRFTLKVPGGYQYRLTGGAEGYAEGSTALDAREFLAPRHVSATIELAAAGTASRPAETPEELAVTFASGSAELGPPAIAGLEQALATIRRDQGSGRVTQVVVVGHTDDVGSDENNLELSRRRAEAARDWLVARGIDAAIVKVQANGEAAPTASNASARGRAQNRRVDVRYVVERAVVSPQP